MIFLIPKVFFLLLNVPYGSGTMNEHIYKLNTTAFTKKNHIKS